MEHDYIVVHGAKLILFTNTTSLTLSEALFWDPCPLASAI